MAQLEAHRVLGGPQLPQLLLTGGAAASLLDQGPEQSEYLATRCAGFSR